MSDLTLEAPLVLLLALFIPALFIVALRRADLGRGRRAAAFALQALSALLMIVALADPRAGAGPPPLRLTLLLDASDSLSPAAQAQAVAFAQGALAAAGP